MAACIPGWACMACMVLAIGPCWLCWLGTCWPCCGCWFWFCCCCCWRTERCLIKAAISWGLLRRICTTCCCCWGVLGDLSVCKSWWRACGRGRWAPPGPAIPPALTGICANVPGCICVSCCCCCCWTVFTCCCCCPTLEPTPGTSLPGPIIAPCVFPKAMAGDAWTCCCWWAACCCMSVNFKNFYSIKGLAKGNWEFKLFTEKFAVK